MTFDQVRDQIIADVIQLRLTTELAGVAAIIWYQGQLLAAPVLGGLNGFRVMDTKTDVTDVALVSIIADPAVTPDAWKSVPPEKLRIVQTDAPDQPILYFVVRRYGGVGLALPIRRDPNGKPKWSGNESLIDQVAALLADAGVITKRK